MMSSDSIFQQRRRSFDRHGEPRVGANARPMTGSAQSGTPPAWRKSRSSLRSVRATGLHPRHCEEHLRRSNPPFFVADEKLDCFAEPVIGRRFAPPRWLAMTGIERGLRQSQEALRIDVDLELEIAFCLRPRGEPFAEIFRQIDRTRRFYQETKTVAALDHGEWGFGRSQHLDARIDRRDRSKPARKTFRGGAVARGDDQAREPAERRIERALAALDFARVKGFAIAGDQRLHHGMLGLVGLQIADAAALIAPGAPDHLVEQLKGALGGAWIAIA